MTESVYIPGTFDCFHRGHARLLRRARDLGDRVVVAVDSDSLAARYRGEPVMNEHERFEVVRACRYVDLALLIESREAQRAALEIVRPAFLVHGDDLTGDRLLLRLGVDRDFLRERGIKLRYLPYGDDASGRDIERRVAMRLDIRRMRRDLPRPPRLRALPSES